MIWVYSPSGQVGLLDLVLVVEDLGGLAEVPAGLEGGAVGRADQLVPGEALVDPARAPASTGREYTQQISPRAKKFLERSASRGLTPERRRGLLGERGHRHLDHPVPAEGVVGEGVAGVAGLREVALVEGVGVDDERPALLHPVQLVAQGGRVHGDQHVGGVARRRDVVVRDVDLEGRDAGQGPRRGPDLGRELGQGGQVVAHPGADAGEAVSCELHPVAGVSGEADDHCAQGFWRVWPLGDVRHVLPHLWVVIGWVVIGWRQSPASCSCECRTRSRAICERRSYPEGPICERNVHPGHAAKQDTWTALRRPSQPRPSQVRSVAVRPPSARAGLRGRGLGSAVRRW